MTAPAASVRAPPLARPRTFDLVAIAGSATGG
jgi:hypothetical protein